MYEYNRSTGIASTRYRPLQTPRLPGFSFHNHRSSHAIHRPCRSSHQLPFQGESNPKTPIPILRVLTLAYARVSLARAFRPAQKDTPLHSIRRTHAEPIRTTHRAAQRYPGARPGCKPPGPGIGQANMSGTLSSSPAEADAGLAASCQDCQWHGPGDSSLVAGPAAATPLCATRAFTACSSRGTCSLHMGSCESVVGAIAEAETAA